MGILQDIKYYAHILEAMAFNRKDAMDFVESQQDEIIKHLIKIAIYNDIDRPTQTRHWEGEILGWLEQSDDRGNNIKKNKSLKLDDYLLCLNNDLPNPSRITRLTRIVKRKLGGDILDWFEYSDPILYDLIYKVILAQYTDMARGVWNHESLTTNKDYITLIEGK